MLFKDLTEIKEFLPIGVGNDFNRLMPHIANAELKYIKPLLGSSMYDELVEFSGIVYPAEPTPVQEATQELLKKVQHATIHLSYFVGFDFLNVKISDAGFQRTESTTSKGLFKYQEDNLRSYFSDSGFNGLDDVLVFLEQNITHFTEFQSHANWTTLRKCFLPTVAVIENIPFNIHGSRLTLLALKPHFSYFEDIEIKPLLGETIYNEIRTEMVKATPSAKVIAILPYIRKPLIYLATAMLMEETGATLDRKGLYFLAKKGDSASIDMKTPSSEQRIFSLVSRNRQVAANYLDMLKSYLVKNVADWAEYSGQTGAEFNRDNNDKKTFWV